MPPTIHRLINNTWRTLPSRSLDLRFGAFDAGPSPFRIRRGVRELQHDDVDALSTATATDGADVRNKGNVEEAVEVKKVVEEAKETEKKEAEKEEKGTGVVAGKKDKIDVQGVEVPVRPTPPGPEECCMSGCAHCVYDLYADALTEYKSLLSSAKQRLIASNVPSSFWPSDIRPSTSPSSTTPPPSLADATSPREVEQHAEVREDAEEEVDEVIKGLDPTTKAFLEMERKIKRKQRERERLEAKKDKATSSGDAVAAGVG